MSRANVPVANRNRKKVKSGFKVMSGPVLPDQQRQALRPGIKKGGIKCSDAESLHRTLAGTS